MQYFLKWKEPPQPGTIGVKVLDLGAPIGYLNAEFVARGQKYIVTVEEDFIDPSRQRMSVFIIADAGDGDSLIELPGESFSIGNRVLISTSDITDWEVAKSE